MTSVERGVIFLLEIAQGKQPTGQLAPGAMNQADSAKQIAIAIQADAEKRDAATVQAPAK